MNTTAKRTTSRLVASLAMGISLATSGAFAADCYWTGSDADGGNWAANGNWESGAVPADGDAVLFASNSITGTKTVTFGAAESYDGNLSIQAGTAEDPVVFQADAAGKGLSASKLSLGTSASGALWLDGGSYSFSGGVEIGGGTGGTGFLKVDGDLTVSNLFRIGCNSGSAVGRNCFELNGGTVKFQYQDMNYAVIGYRGGEGVTNEMRVTGGQFSASQFIYVGGYGNGSYGALTVDGGSVKAGTYVYVATGPHGGDVTLNGGILSAQMVQHGGGAKTGNVTFNGGTLKAVNSYGDVLIPNQEKLVVTVGENGGTIDNGSKNYWLKYITIAKTMVGTGSLTLTGSRTTRFTADQSYTGATTVSENTKFSVPGSGISLAGGLELTAGSTLDIDGYEDGSTPLTLASVLVLPSSGTASLTKDGRGFRDGTYAIYRKGSGDITAEEVADAQAHLKPQLAYSASVVFSAVGDTLYLAVPKAERMFQAGDKYGENDVGELTQTQADWLNSLEDYDTLNERLRTTTQEDLEKASLLNLDIREDGIDGGISITNIVSAVVGDAEVITLDVLLTRVGTLAPEDDGEDARTPIYGTLRLYATTSLDALDSFADCGEKAIIEDAKFANGDMVKCHFTRTEDAKMFFRARIVEPVPVSAD